MTYLLILFMVLFVITAIVHKPLNAYETEKKWLRVTHYWLEHSVVIQLMIIINEYPKGLQ
ncbi:MAG: hypothetical protein LBD60_03695 [Puniceicoccales bacterium]|jgi:hypothetical protein|nr:hypothetical protein [Puniceicoccales bacterium]